MLPGAGQTFSWCASSWIYSTSAPPGEDIYAGARVFLGLLMSVFVNLPYESAGKKVDGLPPARHFHYGSYLLYCGSHFLHYGSFFLC